jgi:sterol desaturase/sphingolipid hydroxylase (fatty acid hydroxylase superfamily)
VIYWHWLAGLSLVFLLLERVWPREARGVLRPGLGTDLFYLVFNGHFLGVGLALLIPPLVGRLDAQLGALGLQGAFYRGALSEGSMWLQFLVAFVAIDLLHWGIHNLLHRVPALWAFHKVHHSIQTMDFLGAMRFHWVEVVVYKSLTYPLLAFFGFRADALFLLAVTATAIGHFNHANLRWRIGPLKYVFNSPEMHIWHHDWPAEGPVLHNFGVNLSLWDWIFGTAHLPKAPPLRLGFEGVEDFPADAPRQVLWPLPLGPKR